MTMKEFYKEYNLNKYDFASIAGVGVKSLIKFEQGEPIRKSTEDRIRKAMHVADIYDLVRPRFDYTRNFGWDAYQYRYEHLYEIRDYEKHFKELIALEG
mgnify:CR=1 FL=1